jgi:hypothetical protein
MAATTAAANQWRVASTADQVLAEARCSTAMTSHDRFDEVHRPTAYHGAILSKRFDRESGHAVLPLNSHCNQSIGRRFDLSLQPVEFCPEAG